MIERMFHEDIIEVLHEKFRQDIANHGTCRYNLGGVMVVVDSFGMPMHFEARDHVTLEEIPQF